MPDALEAEVLGEIRRIFSAELERDASVERDHDLQRDLCVDSLGAVVLAVGLEDRFRVRLDEDDLNGVVTVGDLVQRVSERVRASA